MRIICILLMSFALAACGTTSGHEFTPEQLAPNANVYGFLDQNKLGNAVSVGTVTASESMPKKSWMNSTVVTDTGFKQTLEQSLQKAGWLNTTNNPTYTLNAQLVNQDVPFALFDKKVIMTIQYMLLNNMTQAVDYQENVQMSCPIAFGIGTIQQVENAEEAVRCSVSENITQFMRSLNSKI